ncbi:MAG: 2-oxoacid:acceptor oxidoreductase subunit alpha [Candidatus Latescibacteria bacterium]|nr:2-oxoacid:acceptor oxidoreductase subunit alpha [Candidatus Latescibacterota bacterium]
MSETLTAEEPGKKHEERESVVIRFSGDSGDGMQLTGDQFTNAVAILGNDVSTFPDFPAEIRAPAGTIPGLSGFQVNFGANELYTAGDAPQVLVAMNPAALRANLSDLEPGGVIIVNSDTFTRNNLRKAGYEGNPLEDNTLQGYEVHQVPLTTMTRKALEDLDELSTQQKDLCKNAFALGLAFWMFDRPLDITLGFYEKKFAKRPQVVEANTRVLKAGYHYGETAETFQRQMRVPRRIMVEPGLYRRITGNEAMVLGMVTAASKSGKQLFYGSYPITPATPILEGLAALKNFNVRTFQAEDEISAMGSVIGAAFGGALAATATSGPGIALKSEGMNLALVLELPMVIIDVQRGGPSTGLPTKTEQTDLLQVLFGRNGESPIPVLAAATAGDCFDMAIQAFRIAVRYMTPVILLSDGYIANSSEPWKIPDPDAIAPFPVEYRTNPEGYQPYMRDAETLARPWVIPGTPGLEHRIGGLGKQDITGNVSYSPQDHEHIVKTRAEKVARIAEFIPEQEVFGPASADLLVVGWGGTFGAIRAAVELAQRHGMSVASAHLRYLNPFPRNLGQVLGRYKNILVPELNLGQLALLLQAHFPVRVQRLNKVQGQPFQIREIYNRIKEIAG